MATKQFGKLKLHWSKRGIAFKWGDGEIHRLSFEGKLGGSDAPASENPNDPYGQEYDQFGQGYDHEEQYPPQEDYDSSGYYSPDDFLSRYEILYTNDWVTWALLVLLPPLGIWLLWKRERLEPKTRTIVSGVAAVWFVILLIWIFSGLFGRGADQVVDVGSVPRTDSIVVGLTPTPAPVTTAPVEETTPAPGNTPLPDSSTDYANSSNDSSSNSDSSGTDSNTDNTGATYVWASASDSHYHKNDSCSAIVGTPSKIEMSIATNRGLTQCTVCYGSSGTSTSGSTYYASKGGKYYHTKQNCSGMKNAQPITKTQAQKKGLKPCPECVASYYATKTGNYYHTKSNCSGMRNAQKVTKNQATAAGLKACPVCVTKTKKTLATYYSTVKGKYYHVRANCSGMKNATKVTLATAKKRGQTPCPVCMGSTKKSSTSTVYYATTSGKYYHTKSNCSGMKNARKITLATAKAKGKTACPVCVKKSSTTYVYATTAGKYYHSKSNCSGMKNAQKVTLATAKAKGKTACPVCMKAKSTTYYYSTVGGKYYHAKSNCSGMKNATKVTLATAKKRGQTPCPVCLAKKAKEAKEAKTYVYATTAGKYYHSKSNCSGMKNARKVTLAAAKAKGKTACPVCMKSKNDSEKTSYVYAALSGKYYHKKSCTTSDNKGSKKVALATAKKYGKTACPTCYKDNSKTYVYVTPAGLKYHSKVTCSGIKNTLKITLKTALARKYTRCTVCDAPKK